MQTGDIARVLRAYAAGDAFGVAYEFAELPGEVNPRNLLEKSGWPYGGVSDDTLLTLLTIQSLLEKDPGNSARIFLETLRASISILRGLGPTTRAALGLPLKEIEYSQLGNSNGAMMRTALLGLAFDESTAGSRREYVSTLARATHRGAAAISSALICSSLFSDALVNGEKNDLYELAAREAEAIGFPLDFSSWKLRPSSEISNESIDTLKAVLWTVEESSSALDTLKFACQLGGDTDTVAALATGLIVARKGDAAKFESIPWLDSINWSEIPQIESSAQIIQSFYEGSGVIK